jgi:hypothetical protein
MSRLFANRQIAWRGEYMFHRSVSALRLGRLLACLSLLVCYHGIAQDNVAPAPKSLRVTHIQGLQGLKDNTNGTLTIQAHTLRFQPHDGNAAEIKVSSIKEVALGVQDKEVGGMPLAIRRAATPYGGGRVIALFAHKKYEIVTVKYRDSDGGFLLPGSAGPDEAQHRAVAILSQQARAQSYTLAISDGFIVVCWMVVAYLMLMLCLRPAKYSYKDLRKMQ